jgi:hypothetical protein
MAYSKTVLSGVPLTKENFTTPPMEMGILPFWFWNGAMDEKEMEWQLKEYKAKGITGLFIHGRFGLKVPYVSDAWFEKVKVAVRLAGEIGLDAWVYDEMNWPSGTAERKVPKLYPHLTQKYLELVALNVDGPLFTFLEATDNRYVNTGDSYPIAAFGCTEEEYQTGITHPIDLTQNLSFERVIPWEAPAGKWRLLYFLEKEVPYYIDALNPESTNRFLELTHEGYKRTVGEQFGKTVPGFYTDEPAMHYYHVGIDNFVVPWTSQMFKIFREKRGYDLKPFLPALYASMGEKTARVRYDFWRTLTEQYAETYYKRIRDWCEENGVIFTGHLLFEEWIRLHARCEGNLFKYLQHMHLIGVDHLYPKVGTEAEPDQHVALKIASSAAHHFGSTRLLCESMGGSYWDCTLERMKWIANWEYVLGVNLFNNHGYHYSIEGERKRDWPPSQFYHHTWWDYYPQFTTYMARLSHILSGGTHVAKVLVLYPLTSIWTNYTPQARNAIGNVIEGDFNYLTDALLRLHYDFDFADEDTLIASTLEKGKIKVRDEEFSVLIMPPVTHLKVGTFECIRRFVKAGGTVIADALLPYEFLETEQDGAAKRVGTLFGIDPRKVLTEFSGDGDQGVRVISKKGKGHVYFLKGKGLSCGGGRKELKKVLEASSKPDVTISEEDVFYLHRRKDGFDIYFLVNTTQEERNGVKVTFERVGRPELWDATTGQITPLHVYDVVKERLAITLDFPPAASHIVVIKEDAAVPHVTETNLVVGKVDDAGLTGYAETNETELYARMVVGNRTERLKTRAKRPLKPIVLPKEMRFLCTGDNALLLSRWKMIVGDDPAYATPDLDDAAWMNVTNGAWEMQLPQERDVATYPVTLWYRTHFEADIVPANLRVFIDGFSGSGYQLFVNGTPITDPGSRSRLDSEIREIPIAPYVHAGRNIIAVRLTVQRRTDGILDLLKVVGTFALEERGEGIYAIVAPGMAITVGDWTARGYPFYSGVGVYSCEFELPKEYCEGRLFLEAECGEDVLEVRMNDAGSKVAPWHPYRLDVTDVVREGTNKLELRVTNTLINILEGVRKASGLFAPVRLVHQHAYRLSRPERKSSHTIRRKGGTGGRKQRRK